MTLKDIFPEIASEAEQLRQAAPRHKPKEKAESLKRCPDCSHFYGNHETSKYNKDKFTKCKVHGCPCDRSRAMNKFRVKGK